MKAPDITTEEQISAIRDEREEAREDLRDTLSEVNAKVERAGDYLRPDRMIENHSTGAALMAGAIGFLVGSSSRNRSAGPIIIAALLGFALSRRAESTSEPEADSQTPEGRRDEAESIPRLTTPQQ